MAKRTTKKTANTARTAQVTGPHGKLINVSVEEIDATSFQNQRTGDWTTGASVEAADGNSFPELVDSIDLSGLKDPPTVRPRPDDLPDTGQKWQLIKGFRRFAAVNLLTQRDQEAGKGRFFDGRIDVIAKDLSDIEALEENVFENTARDNLTGPDLAWAAYHLQEQYKAQGTPISDNLLAKRMGKNQSYISKIKKIVVSAPKIAKMWQESPSPLTVEAMKELAELPPDQQESEYTRINAELAGKTGSGTRTKAPLETATNQAKKLAVQLGALELQELITVHIDWYGDLAAIGVKVDDLTVPDKHKVAEIAEKAYLDAKTPKAPPPAKATKSNAVVEQETTAEVQATE